MNAVVPRADKVLFGATEQLIYDLRHQNRPEVLQCVLFATTIADKPKFFKTTEKEQGT